MKQEEYARRIENTPQFKAVFRVIRVPEWAKQHGVKVGDETDQAPAIYCAIQPSYLAFVGYRRVRRD